MEGKPLKKSSLPGVSIRQLAEEIPEGCSTPDFEQKPITLALQEGRNATFRAVVCGEPRPEVHWQCTKGDLSDPSKYQVSSAPGGKEHMLQINKLTGEDADLYRCTAVNMYGEAVCSVRLTVIEVGFRKSQKRHKEPQEDLRKELMDFRNMLKKRAPPPAPTKKMDSEQVWQLLMTADRKDYEQICRKYGIVDYRGMLRKLQQMQKEREDKMAQYVNAISNLRHIKVTKEGVAVFDLELDLKDPESKIYLYKDGDMVPYGFAKHMKHCLRRLGKRYHFQIQDLRPEDAGLYQVKVEDAEVFSTELEVSAIPARVVVPLAEAHCEEQGDAVFECTLSSPCPSAAWHFQHRQIRPSDRYAVFVSPDGLTHRLVVKGARVSDMGLYSLGTGLHASSAWLVVEAGKDKGLMTTGDDRQLQVQEAQASEAEDSGISGEGGKPREQDPMGGSLDVAGLTSGLQLTIGPHRGGCGGHGSALMGNEGADESAWGPRQVREGFPEVGEGRVTLPGENELHRQGSWGGSLQGRPHLQGEGPESGPGFMKDHGRDSREDRFWGTAGGWEAASRHAQVGGQESSWEGREHREDDGSQMGRYGQEQLWDSQMGSGKRVLLGSQPGRLGTWPKGEVMEKISQGDSLGEVEGREGLSREKGRGVAKAVWDSGTVPEEAGDSNGAGIPGALESPGERESSSKAGRGPGSWGSQGGRDADYGEAGVSLGSGESLGQAFGDKNFQEPPVPGGRKFLLGDRSPEAKAEGPLWEADEGSPEVSVVGGRGYKTGSGGPGGRHWEGGPQDLRGRGWSCRDGQEIAGVLDEEGDGSKSLQTSQAGRAGQRGEGGSGSITLWDGAWSSLRKSGAHHEPGVLGSGGEEGDMASTQVAGLMESSWQMDARSHRLIGSPALGVQGSGGTPGGTDRLRGSGAIGPQVDFWEGSWGSRENRPRGGMSSNDSLGGTGIVESSDGIGSGYSRGKCPENEAGYSNGSGMPEKTASGLESEEGGCYRHGSGVSGGIWSGDKDGHGPDRRKSGGVATFKNGSHGPGGGPMDGTGNWDATGGQGNMSPGVGHCLDDGLGCPGRVRSVGKSGLRASETVETVGEGHVNAEQRGSGKARSWGQTGDYGSFRASGALGSFGEGGYEDGFGGLGAMEPGSLGAGGKVGDGDGPRGPGTRATGAGSGSWDDTRFPKALALHHEAASKTQWAYGSNDVLGCGDGSGLPEPQGIGGRATYGGGLRGLGPGGMGSGGEAGFRDGSEGLLGMGLGGEAGYRNSAGGPGEKRSVDEADYGKDLKVPERMGPGNKADYKDDFGGSGKIGSEGEDNYKNALRGLGRIPLGGKGLYGDDLGDSGGISSRNAVGYREGLEGTGEMGPGREGGYRGGSRGTGEMRSGHEIGPRDGSGRYGVTGSLAGVGCKGGPRDQEAMGPGSGYWVVSEGSCDGISSKNGQERGKGMELVNGASTLVGSGMAGMLGTADGTGHRDCPRGPGLPGTQGWPDAPSDGQGSRRELGDYGTSGIPKALGAVDSRGKSEASEWQDGFGISGFPRDREAHSGEGGSADRARGMGTSGFLVGRGPVERETWAETAALESGHEGDFWGAGPGTADRGGAAGQGALAPQGGGDLLQEGRRLGAGWGSSAGAGQALDSSAMPRGKGRPHTSGPADGRGVNNAWAPSCEDPRLGQGSKGAGSQLPSSRASSSLQEKDESETHEGQGGSGGRGAASGQGEAGECAGPWSLENRGSGPRRRTLGEPEGSGVLSEGDSTEPGNDLSLKSGESGPQGAWNDSGSPFSRRDSGDRREEIQGLGSPLGQRGSRVLGEQGSLIVEVKAQASGALEGEGQGAEVSSGSDRRPGPLRSRSQTQTGAEGGGARRWGADEARGMGHLPGAKNRGCLGETLGEDWRQKPPHHLGSRRRGKEGRWDFCGEGRDATQSPRSRYKPSTGGFSKEARGPTGPFSQGLTDTEAQEGEAAIFSCTLTSDLGPGAWFKDGVKLTAQDGVVCEQDGLVHRLLISRVRGTQAGRYTFVAGNQQSEATLTVQDPPTIAPDVTEKLREPLVVKAGKPVTVKIPFESHLPVQAVWRKDGVEMVGGIRGAQVALGDGFTWLCLPSAGRKDCGQYSVMLRSEGGSVQAELTLQVQDKPQPPQGPLEVQDCHGAGICLRWRPPRDDGGRAVGHYVVERRQAGRSAWLKVGEPSADVTTFTDGCVEQGRKYTFRVRAVTSEGAGEALESEEVLVAPEALPGPPSTPAILSASSQGITLTWTAPRGPGSAHLLGYLIEKRKKGSNAWTAVNNQPVPERRWTVVGVRQGCQYEFRITAVAPSGPGEPGPPSDVVFAQDAMRCPGPVRDLQVTDTSHTSLTLSWVRPDAQDGEEAQGYVVELRGSDSHQWSPCHVGTVAATTYTAKGLRPREGYFVRVTAVNDAGHSQPTALDALVQAMHICVRPKFLMDSSKTDSLTVRAGDTIRVPVSFEAAPMPEVTWMKDGLPLPRRSVTTTKEGLTQLLIPAASLLDSGRYTVTLRNLQGKEAAYNFLVKVAACPQAPGPIRLQENVPGTVTAEWEPSPDEARGVPLHYTVLTRSSAHGFWREAADRIHTNRFTLLGVLPGHEYHFRVVAKNELGASEPSDTCQPWCIPRQRDRFTVKARSYREPDLSQKPGFLVGLRAHLLPRGCDCYMSCAVRGSPRPRVTWFRNGQSLEGNPAVYSTNVLGMCSLVIPSVSPQDAGEYKAVAENPLGQAVSTATLIVLESNS